MSCTVHIPSEKQRRAKVLGRVNAAPQSPKHHDARTAPSARLEKLRKRWGC